MYEYKHKCSYISYHIHIYISIYIFIHIIHACMNATEISIMHTHPYGMSMKYKLYKSAGLFLIYSSYRVAKTHRMAFFSILFPQRATCYRTLLWKTN